MNLSEASQFELLTILAFCFADSHSNCILIPTIIYLSLHLGFLDIKECHDAILLLSKPNVSLL